MTARLPLFPLGSVLFPGLVLPLHVFEPRYRELVRHLQELPAGHAREFGVVAIQRGWEVGPAAADVATGAGAAAPASSTALTLHEVGCTAEVRQVTELPDGRFDLVTVGRRRFRIDRVDPRAAPYLVAEVHWLPEPAGQEEAADLLAPRVLAAFRQYLGLLGSSRSDAPAPEDVGEQLPEDPTVLSHLVAATAALTLEDRQRLLAAPDTATRLRTELRLLARETALLRQVRAVPVPLSELAVPPSSN